MALLNWNWPNFKPEEVLSPDGLEMFRRGHLLLQPHALDLLQALRYEVDTPLVVNTGPHRLRGYRSFEENKRIDGAQYSRHPQGIAFDVSWKYSVEELSEAALASGFLYTKLYRSWVHIDIGVRRC